MINIIKQFTFLYLVRKLTWSFRALGLTTIIHTTLGSRDYLIFEKKEKQLILATLLFMK